MSEVLEYTCEPEPQPQNTIQVQPAYNIQVSMACPHCKKETLTLPNEIRPQSVWIASTVVVPLYCTHCDITQFALIQFTEPDANGLMTAYS